MWVLHSPKVLYPRIKLILKHHANFDLLGYDMAWGTSFASTCTLCWLYKVLCQADNEKSRSYRCEKSEHESVLFVLYTKTREILFCNTHVKFISETDKLFIRIFYYKRTEGSIAKRFSSYILQRYKHFSNLQLTFFYVRITYQKAIYAV